MAFAFISEQDKLASPNLNYVWDVNTLSWVKMEQPVIEGGTFMMTGDVDITGPFGQQTMANSIPVVVASDQTPILVITI